MKYQIKYANESTVEETISLSDAYTGLRQEFPGCVIHEVANGRWLVWETEEDSVDDCGADAVAEITLV